MTITAEEEQALLDAAEHGLSLMLGRRYEGEQPIGPLRLYHRCEGCEAALRLLKARGKYPDAVLPDEDPDPNYRYPP